MANPTQKGYIPEPFIQRQLVKNNESSSTLSAGKVCYMESDGGVKIAGADDPLGVLGVAEADIAAGAYGWIIIVGFLPAGLIATDGFSAGDVLSPSTSGALVAVSSTDQKRRVAQVITSHATTGVVMFNGLGL